MFPAAKRAKLQKQRLQVRQSKFILRLDASDELRRERLDDRRDAPWQPQAVVTEQRTKAQADQP